MPRGGRQRNFFRPPPPPPPGVVEIEDTRDERPGIVISTLDGGTQHKLLCRQLCNERQELRKTTVRILTTVGDSGPEESPPVGPGGVPLIPLEPSPLLLQALREHVEMREYGIPLCSLRASRTERKREAGENPSENVPEEGPSTENADGVNASMTSRRHHLRRSSEEKREVREARRQHVLLSDGFFKMMPDIKLEHFHYLLREAASPPLNRSNLPRAAIHPLLRPPTRTEPALGTVVIPGQMPGQNGRPTRRSPQAHDSNRPSLNVNATDEGAAGEARSSLSFSQDGVGGGGQERNVHNSSGVPKGRPSGGNPLMRHRKKAPKKVDPVAAGVNARNLRQQQLMAMGEPPEDEGRTPPPPNGSPPAVRHRRPLGPSFGPLGGKQLARFAECRDRPADEKPPVAGGGGRAPRPGKPGGPKGQAAGGGPPLVRGPATRQPPPPQQRKLAHAGNLPGILPNFTFPSPEDTQEHTSPQRLDGGKGVKSSPAATPPTDAAKKTTAHHTSGNPLSPGALKPDGHKPEADEEDDEGEEEEDEEDDGGMILVQVPSNLSTSSLLRDRRNGSGEPHRAGGSHGNPPVVNPRGASSPRVATAPEDTVYGEDGEMSSLESLPEIPEVQELPFSVNDVIAAAELEEVTGGDGGGLQDTGSALYRAASIQVAAAADSIRGISSPFNFNASVSLCSIVSASIFTSRTVSQASPAGERSSLSDPRDCTSSPDGQKDPSVSPVSQDTKPRRLPPTPSPPLTVHQALHLPGPNESVHLESIFDGSCSFTSDYMYGEPQPYQERPVFSQQLLIGVGEEDEVKIIDDGQNTKNARQAKAAKKDHLFASSRGVTLPSASPNPSGRRGLHESGTTSVQRLSGTSLHPFPAGTVLSLHSSNLVRGTSPRRSVPSGKEVPPVAQHAGPHREGKEPRTSLEISGEASPFQASFPGGWTTFTPDVHFPKPISSGRVSPPQESSLSGSPDTTLTSIATDSTVLTAAPARSSDASSVASAAPSTTTTASPAPKKNYPSASPQPHPQAKPITPDATNSLSKRRFPPLQEQPLQEAAATEKGEGRGGESSVAGMNNGKVVPSTDAAAAVTAIPSTSGHLHPSAGNSTELKMKSHSVSSSSSMVGAEKGVGGNSATGSPTRYCFAHYKKNSTPRGTLTSSANLPTTAMPVAAALRDSFVRSSSSQLTPENPSSPQLRISELRKGLNGSA